MRKIPDTDTEFQVFVIGVVAQHADGWLVACDGASVFVSGTECEWPPVSGESLRRFGSKDSVRGIEIGARIYHYAPPAEHAASSGEQP